MKAIMVMFDSLRRDLLSPYGCRRIPTPSFTRLAEKSVVFDRSYICSAACMPARRELHTGRPNFLHRSWGPIEPYDDSMPEILKHNGIWSHLISDHYHYWEDGGSTYHTRYKTWEAVRGQEGDPWKCDAANLPLTSNLHRPDDMNRLDNINRHYMDREERQPQHVTFSLALEFLQKNHDCDNWFLHVETFDPHEPFYVPDSYMDMFPDEYRGPELDWPPYAPVTETQAETRHMINRYCALLRMCDAQLAKILDFMDLHDMWRDTMLIVNTDHGYLLGEHGWWAKCSPPFYEEVAHTPLFIWDPRLGKKGERRSSLVQTYDLPATLLEFFGVDIPGDMLGKPLQGVLENDAPVRRAGLFGLHGGQVGITDGRYVYLRSPVRPEVLYEYGLMMTRHGAGRAFIPLRELLTAELSEPFYFTKGVRVLKTKVLDLGYRAPQGQFSSMLFDLATDAGQNCPLHDPETEERMASWMAELMREYDAPPETFIRMGI